MKKRERNNYALVFKYQKKKLIVNFRKLIISVTSALKKQLHHGHYMTWTGRLMKAFAYNWPLTCVSEEKDEKRSQALVNFIQSAAFILLFLTFFFRLIGPKNYRHERIMCREDRGGFLGFELSSFCIIINMISDFP